MPLPNVSNGDIMEVRYLTSYIGQRCMNTMHYRMSAVPANTSIDTAAKALHGILTTTQAWAGKYNALQVDAALNDIIEYQVVSPTRLIAISLNGLGRGKTVVDPAEIMPPNTSFSITKQSAVSKRGGNGHFHLCGLYNGYSNGGTPTQAFINTCITLSADMAATYTATSGLKFAPVIYSRKPGVPAAELILCQPEGSWRTMRRRTVGLGQ